MGINRHHAVAHRPKPNPKPNTPKTEKDDEQQVYCIGRNPGTRSCLHACSSPSSDKRGMGQVLDRAYIKDQVINAAGFGNEWTNWAGAPQWGDWGSAFNWATPYLGGFGRRLMGVE